jgi:DivIVA domain-containing protein
VVIEPRTLRQVDFRFRSRGYNPDDVDDFLERLAIGLEALHRQIDEATPASKAGAANETGAGAAPAEPDEVTEAKMRRLLQRSQAEADDLVRVAREKAAASVAEAERLATDLVEKAPEALPIFGQARDLHRELIELEARRNSLWAHVGAFEHLLVTDTPLVPAPGTPHPAPVPCMHVLEATRAHALTAP